MFQALLAHNQGEQYLYKMTALYIGLLHVEELLEVHRCRIYRGM